MGIANSPDRKLRGTTKRFLHSRPSAMLIQHAFLERVKAVHERCDYVSIDNFVVFQRVKSSQHSQQLEMDGWGMLGVGIAVGAVGAHLLALRGSFWDKIIVLDQGCPDTEVIFFPDQRFEWGGGDKIGGGMERILSTLSEAEKSLDLALFFFSNRRLAREVINCMNRGVKVRIVTDLSQMEDQLGSQVGKTKMCWSKKLST